MTIIQKTLLAALVLSAVGFGLQQRRQATRIERTFASEKARLSDALASAATRISALEGKLAAQQREAEAQVLVATQTQAEVSAVAGESAVQETAAMMERIDLLRALLRARPEAAIPELSLLTLSDWYQVAEDPITSEGDVRRALAELRTLAQGRFVPLVGAAAKKFTQAQGERRPLTTRELALF